MIVAGLTGSIGMGKSTVAGMFRDFGVPVFDADAAVHVLQGPGGALIAAIEDAFPGTTTEAGVDRQQLAARVLGDDDAMRRLEAIVHPGVAAMKADFLRKNSAAALVVLDIPLLFEKGGEAQVDVTIVVSAPLAIQRERVLARQGMTPEKFDAIVDWQLPDDDKRRRADVIIDTGVSIDATRKRVAEVVACLLARLGG